MILSVGLAMDAFAASISSSITLKQIQFKQAFKIAFFFGFFQALMPLLGWLAGLGFRGLIEDFDHWIAFGLLTLIGGKMIKESFSVDCQTNKSNPLKLPVLLTLSVAVSIDALAAGVSFGVLKLHIVAVITTIGVITFLFSLIGCRLGYHLGCRFGKRVEFLGGLILIGIGLKILLQHVNNHI